MEMEGRGLSDLFRNTSEEIFLKAVMENSMGVAAAPSMEMLGFRNMSQSFREDSEELFNSWLMNGEIPGFGSANNRPRQPSRLSSEAAGLPNQQHDIAQQNFLTDNLVPQNSAIPSVEYPNNNNQQLLKNAAEKGMQASDLLLAKAWFHSTQPMTRSRSSELRRRYAAMQTHVAPITTGCIEPANQFKQDFTNTTNSTLMSNTPVQTPKFVSPVQTPKFVSPSSSSTSPLDNPNMVSQDTVTSVVSMLKDTLERKKLGSHANKDTTVGNSFGFYDTQQFQQNILGGTDIFPLVTTSHVQDSPMLPKVDRPMEPNNGNFAAPANQVWFGAASREASHSGSSTAMTAHSAGFEVCDELPPMGQAMSVCESTRKNAANGATDCRSKGKEYRERILKDNVKDDRKKTALTRMGSISSEQAAYAADNGDPTKKRRVERSRKMAEAKERSSTPVIPSDMQAVLKRCETLEKEVRSLKLNLSFMNRKDSEQTKQIEELQKQNEELTEEKERLLEEIERVVSDSNT
ncbi:protein CYCLOPS-like isoform X3 [Panicum virgatum]|uniref:protein CYCLOPS-like isoform X3 n=1 Tax=Panicum virgatum TaxID=38727 RepID=UPI0019D5DB7E|nr:protein CYCLOPS-like isoform X3 [Panicum virgatum]XP_039805807.1 protein CYCLOPS-like isoform X3 [Panicum virgatum]